MATETREIATAERTAPRRWRNGRLAEIARLSEAHKRLAVVLLTELPIATEGQLAQRFGYSRSHVSRIMCSQVFRQYLDEKREHALRETVRLRFDASGRTNSLASKNGMRETRRRAAQKRTKLKETADREVWSDD